MNELKNTGICKVVIGEPWSPESGNWIHVVATQRVKVVDSNFTAYTEAVHKFKVQSFGEILPALLSLAEQFSSAARR